MVNLNSLGLNPESLHKRSLKDSMGFETLFQLCLFNKTRTDQTLDRSSMGVFLLARGFYLCCKSFDKLNKDPFL